MNGQDEENRRIYNQGDFTKKRDGYSKDVRKFYWWSIRRGEEEIILGWGPRMSFDLPPNHVVDDPVPQWSCPTVEGVLTKAQFSSPLLYQIHCIGPVGFGFAHIYSERSPPNRDSTIGAVCGKNLCASESDSRAWRDQAPHQLEPTRSQQQGNFPNLEHGRNEEKGRFREESVDTTQTSRSHTRVGSHMSQKRGNERAMQREINDLKRKLLFAQRRQSPPPRHWHTPWWWK